MTDPVTPEGPVTLEGECLCGAVRYHVVGTPSVMFLCHCSRCRKETGTVHAANIFLSDAGITWSRGEALVRHFALPGTRKTRSFCDTCGSPLPRMAGPRVVVPAGGVEGALTFAPNAHIFCDSRATWEDQLAAVPRFPEYAR